MVVNNTDPDHMNRIKVAIPEVMGGIVLWAYSKGQHGSTGSGFKMMAPKNGDIVYITFEYGDPSKPLWEYHGWAQNQIPDILDDPDTMGIVTPNGNRIWLNDKDGSLKMYLYGSATIYAEGPVSINSKAQAYVNASKVIVNQGNNDGIININELTQKLNQLVSEIESLKLNIILIPTLVFNRDLQLVDLLLLQSRNHFLLLIKQIMRILNLYTNGK